MNAWIDELWELAACGEAAVLVTIVGTRGSSPREAGAKMIVTAAETIGTIGGGRLEFDSTRFACRMLASGKGPGLRRFPLGPSLGQCCGGVVDVLFEPIQGSKSAWLKALHGLRDRRAAAVVCTRVRGTAQKFIVTRQGVHDFNGVSVDDPVVEHARHALSTRQPAHLRGDWFFDPVLDTDFNIAVFGAGHVGSTVVRSLSSLDCTIHWIDNRGDFFRATPRNVRALEFENPPAYVPHMPPGSYYIVMTHSHPLDFEICSLILWRGDAAYCGLIGSLSKRRRFEKRYRALGMPPSVLNPLVCPIGIDGIGGKKPTEIAVAVSAELLIAYERMRTEAGTPATKHVPLTRMESI